MPDLYCISDTHFGHNKLWREFPMGRRSWSRDPDHMNEHMIECWNRVVQQDDVVLHLGDFVFGSKGEVQQIRSRLNGTLWLVLGNHDRTKTSTIPLLRPNDVVEKRLTLLVQGATVVCRHRPQDFSEEHDLLGPEAQWWHGHLHDRPSDLPPRFRLFGVDVHGPEPIKICPLNQVTRITEIHL